MEEAQEGSAKDWEGVREGTKDSLKEYKKLSMKGH